MSTSDQSSPPGRVIRDIFQWRRKCLSITVLLAATATWVALEVYQFNFVTVSSWVAMFVVISFFLWGNILRLLRKETPNMWRLEIAEQSAMEIANSVREWAEEGVRWMLHVGAVREWYVFAAAVACLLLLSLLGSYSDLLTFLYIGILVGMTVPEIYSKYEHKIREYGERIRNQSRRIYSLINEKVIKRMKNKFVQGHKKEKKIE